MRIPTAPARPKFSKAIALTTVSILALSLGASGAARADCISYTSSPYVVCEGEGNKYSTPPIVQQGITLDDHIGIDLLPESGEETASLTNKADITLEHDTASVATNFGGTLVGINTDPEGDYLIVNSGDITILSGGRGNAWGIAGGGDAKNVTIKNSGTVSVERALDLSDVGQITSAVININNLDNLDDGNNNGQRNNGEGLGIAAAIFSEEELETFTVTNSGTLNATGILAAAYYTRAEESNLLNEGTISHLDVKNSIGPGIAIAAVSDSGKTSKFTFENNGYVIGDMLMVNGNALRYWLLSNGAGRGNVSTGNIIGDTNTYNVLNINNQFGQLDSNITNNGSIDGDMYFSNGEHSLVNTEEGTISGDIIIDQRNTHITGRTCTLGSTNADGDATCFSSSAAVGDALNGNVSEPGSSENSASKLTDISGTSGTTGVYTLDIWGSKSFTLENAGDMEDAEIYIGTSPGGTISGFEVPDSSIVLKPHIFGNGSGSTKAAPSENSAFFEYLFVGDVDDQDNVVGSSLSRTTVIAPVIDSLVRSGEWFKVVEEVSSENLGDNPEVEGSGLVSWTADTEAGSGDTLAIQATVADASTIAGLSNPGIAALNGLMNVETEDEELLEFAGAIQNLSTADVKKAGEQLAPDSTYGTTRAAVLLASLYGNAIGNRLTGGLTSAGGATGGSGFAPPSGLGMGSGEPKRIEKPMYLQGSGDEVAPSSGREAAWAQAFGANMEQDAISSTGAYDADVYGFMGGYDGNIAPNFRIGAALGYGDTSITEKGVRNGNRTNMESYNATVYAATRGSGWYLTGQLGYTWHDFDTLRLLNAGGVTDRARGTHEGDQFTASGELGAPIRMAGAVVTPVASLAYNKLDQDAYTETSTAGMALAVGSQSSTSLVSGLGVRASFAIGSGSSIEGRAIWLHEFEDTNQTVRASFVTASNAFTSTGANVSQDVANLGAGFNLNSGVGYTLQLNYDAYVSDDFLAHAGTGRVRVEF